jgi:hypothetical protein
MLPSNVDGSRFDFTLNNPPGSANSLGTLKVTLGPGLNQSVLAYMDYDLNFGSSGPFQDVGSVHGALPPGTSFELADPSGTIFGDFSAGTLTNTNTVGVASTPPGPCCDVSWALGVSGVNVPSGSQALLFFTVSSNKPTSGFYLQQTNSVNGETIYFSESGAPSSGVPMPDSFALLVCGLTLLICERLVRRRHLSGLLGYRFCPHDSNFTPFAEVARGLWGLNVFRFWHRLPSILTYLSENPLTNTKSVTGRQASFTRR